MIPRTVPISLALLFCCCTANLIGSDRVVPLPVDLAFLGIGEQDLLRLKSPGVTEAKWKNKETLDAFRFLRNGKHVALYREGDFQVFVKDLSTLENLSLSQNRGGTYGAYPLLRDSVLHLVGGYGFWGFKPWDLYFSETTGGWEMNRMGTLPLPQMSLLLPGLKVGESICFSPWLANVGPTKENLQLWRMHTSEGELSYFGSLDPKVAMIRPKHQFETSNHLLIVASDGRLHLLDKPANAFGRLTSKELNHFFKSFRATDHLLITRGETIEFWQENKMVFSIDLAELGASAVKDPIQFFHEATAQERTEHWERHLKQLVRRIERAENIQMEEGNIGLATPAAASPATWWIALSAVLGGVLVWVLKSRQLPAKHEFAAKVSPRPPLSHLSSEMTALLSHKGEALDTVAFDRLMGLSSGPDTSADTVRARRSKLVKELQAEAQALWGQDILRRERNPDDARMVNYWVLDIDVHTSMAQDPLSSADPTSLNYP